VGAQSRLRWSFSHGWTERCRQTSTMSEDTHTAGTGTALPGVVAAK
jgi:hypothetical protein